MAEFAGQDFDYVITFCASAQESCPVFPVRTERIQVRLAVFRRVRDEIRAKLRSFTATSRIEPGAAYLTFRAAEGIVKTMPRWRSTVLVLLAVAVLLPGLCLAMQSAAMPSCAGQPCCAVHRGSVALQNAVVVAPGSVWAALEPCRVPASPTLLPDRLITPARTALPPPLAPSLAPLRV